MSNLKYVKKWNNFISENYDEREEDIFADDDLLSDSENIENENENGDESYPKLRGVEVTYSNGDVIPTSMAGHLTDDDIRNYFRIGRTFNIGMGANDNLQKVVDVKILR